MLVNIFTLPASGVSEENPGRPTTMGGVRIYKAIWRCFQPSCRFVCPAQVPSYLTLNGLSLRGYAAQFSTSQFAICKPKSRTYQVGICLVSHSRLFFVSRKSRLLKAKTFFVILGPRSSSEFCNCPMPFPSFFTDTEKPFSVASSRGCGSHGRRKR